MRVTIGDPIDDTHTAVLTVDTAHHEIHEGKTYTCTHNATINLAGTAILHIKTPNSNDRVHMTWGLRCSGELNVAPIEGVSITGNGTAVTTFCRRRDERKTTATCLVYHTPTYSGGTAMPVYHFGSGQNVGAAAQHDKEWVLAKNTSYILLVTSEANGNDVTVELDWYEHKDDWL